MKINSLSHTFLFIGILIVISGCQAPRNNPLDPENPGNLYQHLSGETKSVSIPYHPIPEVKIHSNNFLLTTVTDQAGKFSIELIDAPPGWIYFTKNGYYPDSSYISWENSKAQYLEILLNAHPVMQQCEVYSIIENRYPSLQTERMQINIELSDVDNDIDSVFLNIDILDQIHLLPYNTTNKLYERTFTIYDLDVQSLEQLTGHAQSISVKDIFDNMFTIPISPVRRVIREEVLFISPSGNELTTASPTLSWHEFNPGFSHTYTLEIFTSEITPQRVWYVQSQPDSLTEYIVDMTLPANEYFWVIWAVDAFGNRTRSKPASFKIE